jgi:hypothetical protein
MSDETTLSFKGIPIKAPEVFVKGGTTSSRYDNLQAEKAANAEARRKHEDALAQLVDDAPNDGAIARTGSQRMVTAESPKLVLRYLNRDGSIRQECISEITFFPVPNSLIGEIDQMFTLVCPRCLERGIVSGESQLMIQSRHRKWHLDERHRMLVPVETPDGPIIVHQAGTVTCDDIIRCSNFNCTWAVRIDNSNVREV